MHTTRRQFLARTSLLGGVGLLTIACGQTAPTPPTSEAKPTTAPTAAAPAASPAAQTAPAAASPASAASPAVASSPAASPVAAAPAAPARPASRVPAGEIKVAMPAKIAALDPHGAQSVEEVAHTALQHVMEPLVRRDAASGNLVPALAAEWKSVDPTTWTFTLRGDARFHDGSKVTSADVKATLERVIGLKGPVAPLFAQVDALATPDDSSLQIKTKAPVGTLLASLTMVPIAPGAKVNDSSFFTRPIGSGPFKVASWSPDGDLKLEANDDYWGGPPGLKGLSFRNYREVAPLVTALETGEIDFTWRLPPDQLPGLQRNPEIKVDTVPGYTYYFIWMNASREPFTDKRVRQAMAYALDVDTLVKDLLGGIGRRATAPIASTVFGHAPQAPYAYDPDKAKALLAEAGQANGFEVGLIWNPGSAPQDRELLDTMIAYWSKIGVRVKSQEMERAIWIDNLTKLNWDLDLQVNATTTGDADFTLGRLYHSRANRNGYKNPELDKILDDAVATVDQSKRKELYAQANKIIWEDAVGIFPAELLNVYAARKRVSGFTPSASPILTFSDVTVQ